MGLSIELSLDLPEKNNIFEILTKIKIHLAFSSVNSIHR
jgi:hypothetical protein